MTKSITIINSSNWEHENYIITINGRKPITLKPGEGGGDIHIESDNLRAPEPFTAMDYDAFGNLRSYQLIPEVEVKMKRCG